VLALASLLGEKSGAGCVLEDLTNALVGLCGTLKILVGTDLLPDLLSLFHKMLAQGQRRCLELGEDAAIAGPTGFTTYLLWCNWLLASLVKLLDGLLVVAEILLTSNEYDWEPLAEMENFGDPLRLQNVSQALQARVRGAISHGATVPSPGRCRANRGSRQRSR
jgi:hypothetical protein